MAPAGFETSSSWVARVKLYYYNRYHSTDIEIYNPTLAGRLDPYSPQFLSQGPAALELALSIGLTWSDVFTANLDNWQTSSIQPGEQIAPNLNAQP
ncbi:MAG: hypothetical protein E4G98_07320 [Promethearchaeota archaeon]|nr:MAG: hypothetical protein E4G98_07320 [Candidatus Lokiarchaeota archaeon]